MNNSEISDIENLILYVTISIADTTADVLESSQELAELVADVRDLTGKEEKLREKMPGLLKLQ